MHRMCNFDNSYQISFDLQLKWTLCDIKVNGKVCVSNFTFDVIKNKQNEHHCYSKEVTEEKTKVYALGIFTDFFPAF